MGGVVAPVGGWFGELTVLVVLPFWLDRVLTVLGKLLMVPVALIALPIGLSRLHVWARMRLTSPTPAGSVTHGATEVVGTAVPDTETVTAPFTGTECVFCEALVVKSNSKTGDVEASECRSVPFSVEDDTGSVLVDPSGADATVGTDFETRVSGAQDPPPGIQSYLEANDGVSHDRGWGIGPVALGGDTHWFSEKRIEPGDEVYVYGSAVVDPTERPTGMDADAYMESAGLQETLRTGGDLVISTKGEVHTTRYRLWIGIFATILGGLAAMGVLSELGSLLGTVL